MTISRSPEGKTAETGSVNPIGPRTDGGTVVNQSATKPQTMERAASKHSFSPGSMLRNFIHGGEGSSAVMTVSAVAGGAVIGAATGFMTIGYPFAAIIFGVGGAAFGWYAARHPNGD